MRIGSLFSGAGGLDLAVEGVFGGRTVWHCEIDPAAAAVLAHRWPGVPNLGSVTDIDWSTVEPVDVLCGGFPCQDLSCAGQRAGLADGTRSGLWAEYARAVDILRPRWVVIENVRGILSAAANRTVESDEATVGGGSGGPVLRALGAVLGDLANLGYDAQWVTVAASSVGAPHRRERVFILATPADASDSAGHGEWSRPQSRQGSQGDAADAARDGWNKRGAEPARLERRPDAAVGSDEPVDLLPTPRSLDATGVRGRTQNRGATANARAGLTLTDVTEHLLPTPNAEMALLCTPSTADGDGGHLNRSGDRRGELLLPGQAREMSTTWGKYEPAIRRWEQIAGPAPSPTEPNRNGNPRLAPAFSEWMMGWPAGWVTDPEIGISRNDQLRIIGNGVVPQQAIAALRWLLHINEAAA